MIIKIRPCSNGSVLIHDGLETVFKHDEDDHEGLVELLYTLIDIIEPNQKYNRLNIDIKTVHGIGYECKDENCLICKEGK